jgi:hypothetical protein
MRFAKTKIDQLMTQDYAATMAAYGTVLNQSTSELERYDIKGVAPSLATQLFDFWTDPPRTEEGHKCWPLVVASRQSTKSYVNASCAYLQTAFNPGQTGGILADKRERADDLFKYINWTHYNLPPELRPTVSGNPNRKLSFTRDGRPSGSLATFSLDADNQGIGRSWDAAVLSEVPFMRAAENQWYVMEPAFVNRKEAMMCMESTPAPLSEPSAEFFRDICFETMGDQTGRFRFIFMPFYRSKLNERIWRKDWKPTPEEINWLRRYGPRGNDPVSAPGAPYLTLENLAFRRHMMKTNPRLRRDPQLFWVFYPMDPVSCWQHKGSGSLPLQAISNLEEQIRIPWNPDEEGLQIYEEPQPDHQYVIGVDPSGFGAGDQASIQVLSVFEEEVTQVAEFSSRTADPLLVARVTCELAGAYNDAMVVVENNGVGLGVLSQLVLADSNYATLPNREGDMQEYHIKNLYYHAFGKPGVPATRKTNAQAMSRMIDYMLDKKLRIRGDLTFAQISSYRRDKEVVESETFKILRPGENQRGRREKHHWDRVSALLWACWFATQMPTRFKPYVEPESDEDDERREYADLTAAQWQKRRWAKHREERQDKREAERARRRFGLPKR